MKLTFLKNLLESFRDEYSAATKPLSEFEQAYLELIARSPERHFEIHSERGGVTIRYLPHTTHFIYVIAVLNNEDYVIGAHHYRNRAFARPVLKFALDLLEKRRLQTCDSVQRMQADKINTLLKTL